MGIEDILLLVKLFNIFADLTSEQIIRIKRDVDTIGNVVTKIVHMIDSDGDGEEDTEETLLSFNMSIPDLSDYCLCNKGNQLGLGYPALKTLDSSEVLPVLQELDSYISDGEGMLIDYDNDGAVDDILFPSPYDFTGDGAPDFQIVVDDDDNGVPDVAPDSPFYPVGSEEYQDIVAQIEEVDYTIMNKPLSKYTVTEGILFLFLIFGAFGVVHKMFRRKKVV